MKPVTTLKKAEQSVIRAAKAWVNYEDAGMANTIHMLPNLNARLVNAAARLEKIQSK